jgi:uncharacterized protein (DUF2267 family)
MSDPTPTPTEQRKAIVDGITAVADSMRKAISTASKGIADAVADSYSKLPDHFKENTMADFNDHLDRVYTKYGDEKPYTDQDTLQQKLWSVVDREVGPNEADLVTSKLVQAVEEHIAKAGVRR